jgi:thioredoxin-related protein
MTASPHILAGALALALTSATPSQAAELIMVDHRGCSYCVSFNREVTPGYAGTEAGQAAPLRHVSPLKKWPSDLAGVTPARFTPVFILVDEGREIGRFAGYNGEASFWSRLQPLLAKLD